MNYLPFIAWYLILLPAFFLAVRKSKLDLPLSMLIFLVISGRTPFPFGGDIELWMLFSLYFPLVAWQHVQKPNFRNLSLYYGSTVAPLSLIFIALLILIGILSSILLPPYNDGYLLLLVEIASLVIYIILNDSGKIFQTIAIAFGLSTFLMIELGLCVQLLIFLGLADCQIFSIYHPQGDIHCLPSSFFEIYRFSIGSNINEFSFYILVLVLLFFSKNRAAIIDSIENINIFAAKRVNPLLSVYLPVFLASFLSLSRALWLALCVYCVMRLIVFLSLIIYRARLPLFGLGVRSLMFLAFLCCALLICCFYFSDMYQDIFALLSSRGSFVVDPAQIFEGSSSRARLDALFSTSDSNIFSLFPLHSLGSGTFLHNTFLQFIIEFGSLAAILGALVIAIAIKRAPLYLAPIFIFMLVHHIFYNPITWISLFYFSLFRREKFPGNIFGLEPGIEGDSETFDSNHS